MTSDCLLYLFSSLSLNVYFPYLCSCEIIVCFQIVLYSVTLLSATVFAALRVFAIFGRDKWLFAIVLLSGMVNPGLSIWAFVMSKPDLQQVLDYQWCTLDIKGNYQHYEIVMMVARAASVFSDGLVFVLTCSKTICGRIRVDINNTTQTSVSEALSIDTILCFGTLCIVNIIGIVTGHLTQFIAVWTTWTAIFTSVLLSRLVLDLREAYDVATRRADTASSTTLKEHVSV